MLAGFLYAVDVRAPFVLAAVLFVVAAIALPDRAASRSRSPRRVPAGEPAPGGRPRPSLREALEGLRFVRRQPVLLGAISLDLFAVLFGGALALLPGGGGGAAGRRARWASAGCGRPTGSGAAAVTGVLAFRPLRSRVGPALLLAVALFGAATIVLGPHPHLRAWPSSP